MLVGLRSGLLLGVVCDVSCCARNRGHGVPPVPDSARAARRSACPIAIGRIVRPCSGCSCGGVPFVFDSMPRAVVGGAREPD